MDAQNDASMPIETIKYGETVLCVLIRANPTPRETTFYTPDHANLQVGKIVYPGGSEIPRHTHRPVVRTVQGTSEVIVVQKGRLMVDLYGQDQEYVTTREMAQGDVVAFSGGGHGFRLLEDTVLLEVKQGPYSGLQEKDRF